MNDDIDKKAREADSLLSQGNWEKARDIYEKISSLSPRGNYGLGLIAFHQGRYDKALSFLNSLPQEYNDIPEVASMLAIISLSQMDRDKIRQQINNARSDQENLLGRGLLAAIQGDYEIALKLLAQIPEDHERLREEKNNLFQLVVQAVGGDITTAREYQQETLREQRARTTVPLNQEDSG